jgi:hypothetical protein
VPCSEVFPVGRKVRSSQPLDLFPVKAFFELGYEGLELRIVVDCFELETPEPANPIACSLLAADHTKKMKIKTLLGLF